MKIEELLLPAAAVFAGWFLWRKFIVQSPERIASQVVSLAQSQVGVTENAGKDTDSAGRIMQYMVNCGWDESWGPAGWCMGFSGWCWNVPMQSAGLTFPTKNGRFWDTCTPPDAERQAEQLGIITDNPKPGDMLFIDLTNKGEATHTGIVVANDGKHVTTIEGNYSNSVQLVKRSLSSGRYASIERALT